MNETKIEKNDNTELQELTHGTTQKRLTPFEEYSKEIRKRRAKIFLFILLLLVEFSLGAFLCSEIFTNDLHYRVTKQIENNLKSENKFAAGTYLGETDFGYFIGEGTFNFTSGTVFAGQWSNNKMNGLGELNVPSEGTYKGEFLESKKSGQGTFSWDDGAVYEGEWKNDQMNGQGTYISPENIKYVGTFKENKFWEGTCKFENDTGTYTATYKDSSIDNLNVLFADGTQYSGVTDGITLSGTGNMVFSNGDTYTGEFENGFRNGSGVYVWSTGDRYDGAWDKDAMSGSGKYTYYDGSYANGTFEENQFVEGAYKVVNSFGEYTFKIENQEPVSVDMKLESGTQYIGDMKDGKLTGTAQITYSNGDKYSGRVVDGYKSGQGSYSWSGGASYEGDWKEDKMSGQGTYFYSKKETGYKLTGTFEKGVPNGECRYYVSSSESYKTDWKNGKCVKVYE